MEQDKKDKQLIPVAKTDINDLDNAIGQVLLMEDKCINRLISYTIVANALRLGPVWALIVAPPSGGKSELLQATLDVQCMYMLSSLTANTLISGVRGINGKSASLLDELDGKILLMKDLTTIVEMNKDERRAILAQLREIYDKRFSKAFGTGERKFWEGHVGFLAAITDKGAEIFGSRGSMGERFITYKLKQPNRRDVLDRVAANELHDFESKQLDMRKAYYEYITPRINAVTRFTPEMRASVFQNKELMDTIFEITDFATMARSTVEHDFKSGKILYVHPHEMPTRFAKQLIALGQAAIFSHTMDPSPSMQLDELDKELLVSIAWNSIPSQRGSAIKILTKYANGSTKAVAAKMGYETEIARLWLADLAALKLIKRDTTAGGSGDRWSMDESYRKLISKHLKIKMLDVSIEDAVYKYSEEDIVSINKNDTSETDDYYAKLAEDVGNKTSNVEELWDSM